MPNSKALADIRSTSIVGTGVAFTIWFMVYVAAVLVPMIVAPILFVAFLVYLTRQKSKQQSSARSRADRLAWSAVWLLVFGAVLVMPCVGVPILMVTMHVQGITPRITTRLSTRSIADRLAWLAFTIGVWTMLGITLRALLGESDGDYRDWDVIRRHTRILLAAATFAAGVPALLTIAQHTARATACRKRHSHSVDDAYAARDLLDEL